MDGDQTGQGAAKPVGSGDGLEQAAFAGTFMLNTPSTALRNITRLHFGYIESFDCMDLYLKIGYVFELRNGFPSSRE